MTAKEIVEKEQKAYMEMVNGTAASEEWVQFYTSDARCMAPGPPTVCGREGKYLLFTSSLGIADHDFPSLPWLIC